jgi:hypothetical protein
MLAQLSFEELRSESFIRIGKELELRDSLRRKTLSIVAFLVSQNPLSQWPGTRFGGTFRRTYGWLSKKIELAFSAAGSLNSSNDA